MSSRCPLPDRLRAFAVGMATDEDARWIVEHLDECPDCEQTVDALEPAGDTLVAALRSLPADDPAAGDPCCRQVEVRVRELLEQLAGAGGPSVDFDQTNPLIAETIGPYQLLGRIGAGGMGVVYRALHRKLGKPVALKVLSADRTRDRTAVARFEREMRAVGKLDHPHLVRATDAGEAHGIHFLVMELVDGLDLSTLVRHHRQLPVAEACEVIRQAALGLQEAHRNGLVHRDIKPSNLMLARSPRSGEPPQVKILDLGLARLTNESATPSGELTSEHQVVGTLNYLAPEQASNPQVVDIRTDIYSLGVTFYKLLTGEVPFPASRFASPRARLLALPHIEPESVDLHLSGVPSGLAAVVQRMLARDPAQRYGCPQEVADELLDHAVGHNLNRLWPDGAAAGFDTAAARTMRTADHRGSTPSERRRAAVKRALGIVGLLTVCGAMAAGVLRTTGPGSRPLDSSVEQHASVPPARLSTAAGSSTSRELTVVERNRRAVDWALGVGGKVTVIAGGRAKLMRAGDELPFNSYELVIDLNLNSHVDDAGLENLRGATAIRELILNGTRISSLEPLVTLTNLRLINCSLELLDADDVKSLAAVPSLRHLYLGTFASRPPSQEKTDAVFAAACQIPQVVDLGFGSFYYSLGDAALAELRYMPQLRSLALRSRTLTDEGIRNLPPLSELTWLALSCGQVTARGLVHLDRCPKLHFLWLGMLDLNDDDMQDLPDLPQLNALILDDCRALTGTGLARWKIWPRLNALRVVEMPFADSDLQALASVANQIQELSIVDSPRLTVAAVDPFSRLQRLTSLELTGCSGFTDDSVAALARLRGLSRLNVARTALSPEGVAKLRQALPNTTVTTDVAQ